MNPGFPGHEEGLQRTLIVCFDAGGGIVYANNIVLDLLGLEARAALLGRPVTDVIASPDLMPWVAETQGSDGTLHLTTTLAEAHGRQLPMRWFIQAHATAEDPACVAFQAVGIDFSESRRLRERLRLFASVADNIPFGVVITDSKGTIEYANTAMTGISGYAEGELLGQSPKLFRSDETAPELFRQLWEMIAAGNCWSGDLINLRKNGDNYWAHVDIAPVRDDSGQITHYFSITQDLSQQRAYVRQIEYLSSFDQLTGLPNRLSFITLLAQAIERARLDRECLTIAYLDLDDFKNFNESLGQVQGDQILLEVTRRIQTAIRRDDTLARIGSDEFVVLLRHDAIPEEAIARIMQAIRTPFSLDNHTLSITCCIGVTRYPADGDNGDQLLANADAAMAAAKEDGGDTWKAFAARMNEPRTLRADLLSELRRAVDSGQLVLHYQPQLSLASGEVIGVEALVRWNHPQRGLVAPGMFIPLAEESGLIIPISEWVVDEACRQAAAWQATSLPRIKIGVNLSARHFRYADLPETIAAMLGRYGLDARWLELELTESVMMRDAAGAIRVVDSLKEIGVRISLDDFGTGYSSLAYLSRFAIDTLKIDQSFVRDITTNAINASIATATIAMAHKLGKTVIAEGVETAGQMSFLRRHECDEMQGFLFSRPIPALDLAALLARGDKLDVHGGESGKDLANRILLVDDEHNILSALRRLLRREGYQIFTADSGAEGLELLARETVQVIISDQRMPEMTGTEFLGKVKDMYPNTIRIVLSGYSEISSVTEAINRGAIYKYFSKPWDDERLKEDIRLAFREHRERFGGAV